MGEDGTSTRGRAAPRYSAAPDDGNAAPGGWAQAFARTVAAVAVVEDDRVAFATPAFAALHGCAPDALVGVPLADLYAPGARDAAAAAHACADERRVHVFECEHVRRDGATFPAREHVSVAPSSARRRTITLEDLSASVARERLLHETQRVARVGSWEWDVATGRLTWSETSCALYGVAPDDAPATFDAFLARVHADDRDHARRTAERACVDGRPFAFDHRVVHPDRTVRTLHGRGEAVHDAAGRVVRMLGSSEDVTDRRRAAERMRHLQALPASLVAAGSERAVADVVLGQGCAAFSACGGTVARLLDGDDAIEIVAHAGYDGAVADRYRRYPLAGPSPTTDALRSGRTLVLTDEAAFLARYPFLAGVFAAMGARGCVAVPLRVADRTMGGLTLYLSDPAAFGDDEMGMLVTFAGQCAQAMARVRHFEAEQAGRAAERFLAAASRELAESLDHEATLQRVLELAVPAVADWAVFYRAEPSGAIRRIAIAGPDDVRERLAEMDARHPVTRDAPGAISRAVRESVDVLVPDVTDAFLAGAAMDETHAAALQQLGYRSVLIVPLRAHDAVTGALLFGTGRSRRPLGMRELDLARRLADRAALAIESSRLYAEERRARAAAEAAQRRGAFLGEASRILGASLDFAATLQRVARTFVPDMADWCTVDLVNDAATVDLVAVAHVEPSLEGWARSLRARHPVRLDDAVGLGRVLREGVAEFLPSIDDALIASVAQSPEELAALGTSRLGSYLCVPLRVRGAVIGAITFAYTTTSGRRYDEADLALAEELARRAATAIDHARAYRTAQTANQAKSEFLAVMSHELRTPLNAIGGYVELLELELRGPVTDAQRRDLARIRVSQQHLLGLISAVLDLSRIESGRVSYTLEAVPVDAFLQSLDALIAPQVAAKSLTLEYRPCAATLGVRADREKLRQVLLNLLSNAVRYTPAGGRVSLAAEPRDSAVAIVVADTGIGIPTDAIERIFEPFVQLDRTLTPAREGVGLGLAISRDLARGMGGDLVASSAPGAGSAFVLTLPTAPFAGDWLATGQYTAIVPTA